MAVLQTLRVKLGVVISVIIALSLLSFIIDTNTLDSALSSMSKKNDVGQIAGKSVSYTEFQEEIDKYTTINQIVTNSTVQDEQTQTQIRNAAWQSYIDKYLFVKNAKAALFEINVSPERELPHGKSWTSPRTAWRRKLSGRRMNPKKMILTMNLRNLRRLAESGKGISRS